MATKYFKAETSYEEGEAEYDGADYNYQVVDASDDIICLCPTAEIRDKIFLLLCESEISK